MYGPHVPCPRIGKDGDEDMLLDIKRPGYKENCRVSHPIKLLLFIVEPLVIQQSFYDESEGPITIMTLEGYMLK